MGFFILSILWIQPVSLGHCDVSVNWLSWIKKYYNVLLLYCLPSASEAVLQIERFFESHRWAVWALFQYYTKRTRTDGARLTLSLLKSDDEKGGKCSTYSIGKKWPCNFLSTLCRKKGSNFFVNANIQILEKLPILDLIFLVWQLL